MYLVPSPIGSANASVVDNKQFLFLKYEKEELYYEAYIVVLPTCWFLYLQFLGAASQIVTGSTRKSNKLWLKIYIDFWANNLLLVMISLSA